jgi:hypothetical protein
MEQDTSPLNLNQITNLPVGVVINTREGKPYIEIWNSCGLVIAGWLYDSPNYVDPPTVQDYWDRLTDGPKLTVVDSGPAWPKGSNCQ